MPRGFPPEYRLYWYIGIPFKIAGFTGIPSLKTYVTCVLEVTLTNHLNLFEWVIVVIRNSSISLFSSSFTLSIIFNIEIIRVALLPMSIGKSATINAPEMCDLTKLRPSHFFRLHFCLYTKKQCLEYCFWTIPLNLFFPWLYQSYRYFLYRHIVDTRSRAALFVPLGKKIKISKKKFK